MNTELMNENLWSSDDVLGFRKFTKFPFIRKNLKIERKSFDKYQENSMG